MTEKKPTGARRATAESRQGSGALSLDRGVPSLVAQDSPDDSQLGAPPAPAGKKRPTP